MRISVAMTTYNGEKYIIEQLDSLRKQSVKIDEVIIQDDCSNDSTVVIIANYIKKWNLDDWYFSVNESNVGWIKNFHQCISRTNGDIVFFCDQDDIWELDKIEKMCKYFQNNQKMEVLACRVSLIDSKGEFLKTNKKAFTYSSNGTLDIKKVKFNRKFVYNISPGCTMAVTRRYIKKLEFSKNASKIPHDALYWKIGVLFGDTYIVDEPLIRYRIHANNTSKPSNELKLGIKNIERRKKEANSMLNTILLLYTIVEELEEKKALMLLSSVRLFCFKRLEFLNGKSPIEDMKYVIQYGLYYNNARMLAGDVLSRFRKK